MKNDLDDLVRHLTALVEQGDTLRAMDIFYDENVAMQENQDPPRLGKQACLAHERRNLAGVKSMSAKLLNQAVDHEKGVVFNEWEFIFQPLEGAAMRLLEVSVQHWREGKVVKERFYYDKAREVGTSPP